MSDFTEHPLYDAATVTSFMEQLAGSIFGRKGSVEDLLLLGIRRRGVPISERVGKVLEERHGKPIPLGVLDITLYRDDLSLISPNPQVRGTDIGGDLGGKRVILVDDVLYTGRTIRAAMDAIADFGRPQCIELAVLIDRGHRELPIQPDHVGATVETTDREVIEVHLTEIDGEDGIQILRR